MAAPTWPVFVSKLAKRFLVAKDTMAFCFEKPRDWTFKAGQFVDITLSQQLPGDPRGNIRGFSIASAPEEEYIMVATRLTGSPWKKFLSEAPLGYEVKIEGPFGTRRDFA